MEKALYHLSAITDASLLGFSSVDMIQTWYLIPLILRSFDRI